MQIERELKFHLKAAAPPRLARLAGRRRKLASVYYDTPDGALRRAGLALRLRRVGNVWWQTLKSEAAPHAGLAARLEWELRLRRKALDLGAFPRAEILRASGVNLPALARRLRPVFETRFTRQAATVPLDGKGSAELAIDRGVIIAGRRRETIREVELELKSGEPRALLRFAEQMALPLAYESKAERGYRLACGLAPAPRKWRMPRIDPAGAPAAAFAALFSAALAQAGANARGVLESSNPEYVHQMRVGLRRSRSLLRVFAVLLDKPGPLRRRLRSVMRALAQARDWDVFVERLEQAHASVQVVGRARRRGSEARRAARDAVSSPQCNALLLKALRWLESRPWKDTPLSLARFGEESVARLQRKALKAGNAKDAASRHALRIRIKRLRYASEFFAPCFAPAAARRYVKQLQALQDILGELNDIAVGRKLCREIDVLPPAQFAAREKALLAALSRAWAQFERMNTSSLGQSKGN